MSVVIGYSCDRFSLIATDTRVSNCGSMDNIIDYTDRNIKLRDLENLGFEAGAGLHSFLYDFHSSLDNIEIKDTDDLLSKFKTVVNIYNEKDLSNEQKEALKHTASMVSFTSLNNEDGNKYCKNGILSVSSDKLQYMEKDKIFILYPLDYINDKDLIERLNNKFNMNYIVNEEKDVKGLMKYIMDIFQEVSSNSNYVSSYCHIGVLASDWKEDYRYYILDSVARNILTTLNEGKEVKLEEVDITLEQLNKKLIEMKDEGLIDYKEDNEHLALSGYPVKINLTEEGKLMIENLI